MVEDLIREAGPVEVRAERRSWRGVSVFAALALVVGGVVLAKAADSETPKAKVVTSFDNVTPQIDSTGAVLGRTLGFGAPISQFNFGTLQAIVCPILAALAGLPFVGAVIQALRVFFGCISP